MTEEQHKLFSWSLLCLPTGILLVTLFGRFCSELSRKSTYALCVAYVVSLLLSMLIISFGIHYGYIDVANGGKFTGVLGWPIQFILNWIADVSLPFIIFFCDIAFTLFFSILIFVLGGLTNSLPHTTPTKERFDAVFSASKTGFAIEKFLSKAGQLIFWCCGMLLAKSITSASALLLISGVFSIHYGLNRYDSYFLLPWFVGISMFIYAFAFAILSFVLSALLLVSGDSIYFNHDLWRTIWFPRLRWLGRQRWFRRVFGPRVQHFWQRYCLGNSVQCAPGHEPGSAAGKEP